MQDLMAKLMVCCSLQLYFLVQIAYNAELLPNAIVHLLKTYKSEPSIQGFCHYQNYFEIFLSKNLMGLKVSVFSIKEGYVTDQDILAVY